MIAGAPVYSPTVYSNAMLRVQAFHARPESNLRPEQVPVVQKAVLAACDMKDGVADGVLTDPRACTWDPKELVCSGAPSASCLTLAQAETVRKVYAGVKTNNGEYAAMPLMRGGESDWVRRMVGTPELPRGVNAVLGAPVMTYVVKANPAYDVLTFDPERDMPALKSGLAGEHLHQMKTDISAFVNRGGKLLLWHGFNDPGPSALSTIEYFEQVQAKGTRSQGGRPLVPVTGRASLRRRRGPRPLRCAHGARELGRAGEAAGIDAGDKGRLAVVAAAVSVSAIAAVHGQRRHQRRAQFHLRPPVKPGA